MWWSVNMDSMAMVAKDRHSEMLAEAQKQQMLHDFEAQSAQTQGFWQRVRPTQSNERSRAGALHPAAQS